MHKPDLTLLSTFSGIGGFDLGFESAGFESLGCIEFDAQARETLRSNRPNWRLLEPADILELSGQLLPSHLGLKRGDLSVVVGGPPCQPFSKAAQWSAQSRKGMRDTRSDCIYGMVEIVRKFLPHVVVLENVSGFVQGKQSAFGSLSTEFKKINKQCQTHYRLEWRILNASLYGVPQVRERAIIIATRDGSEFDWPHATAEAQTCAWDAIGEMTISAPPRAKGKWAKLLPSIPEGHNYIWHTEMGKGIPLFGYRCRYWSFLLKLAKHLPAWTIPAQPGPASGPFHWHNRPLSSVERLRLQSFPPDWKVSGSVIAQVRQIGNATPPLLAEVIARAIAEQFFGKTYKNPPQLTIPRRSNRPPPEPNEPVAKQYRGLVGSHSAHPGSGKGPNPKRKDR